MSSHAPRKAMLRRISALTAAVLALAVLLDCSSTKKEDKPTALVKINPQFVPKRIWSTGLGKTEPKLQLGLAPSIDGSHVYADNAVGDVVALDLANGRSLWRHRLKLPLSGGTGT